MEDKFKFLRLPLLVLGIFVVVGISGYSYFFYSIMATNDESALIRGDILLKEKKENREMVERNLLRGTEKERQILDNYFVNSNSIISFIERLEGLGRASGVRLTLSSVDIDNERKNALKINLRASGMFSGIYYLVSLIEAMPYEIDVTRFSISKSGSSASKDNNLWEGDVSLELFSFISSK